MNYLYLIFLLITCVGFIYGYFIYLEHIKEMKCLNKMHEKNQKDSQKRHAEMLERLNKFRDKPIL